MTNISGTQLGEHLEEADLLDMIRLADVDKDGRVSLAEFLTLVESLS